MGGGRGGLPDTKRGGGGAVHFRSSLVPRPTSQLRMDYITTTRIVRLVSSCTNFCPVAPECWSDQSDLRYAHSSYQSKLSDISYGGKARDG